MIEVHSYMRIILRLITYQLSYNLKISLDLFTYSYVARGTSYVFVIGLNYVIL